MSGDLEPLFNPGSVAVIGASATPGKIGNIVFASLKGGGREVFPVNPNETEILGSRCYASVADVPSEIDLALVALPSSLSVDSVRDCVDKGVKFIVVASSGFGEGGEDGRELEAQLVEAIAGRETRILGPNTMGLFVPGTGLDTLFVTPERSRRPKAGPVAVVSQSGAVAISFLEKAESAGMGVSACVCLGNRCDIDELELIDHFALDDGTKCIALYLESFSDGRAFVGRAGEVAREKPIVLLKTGRTTAGGRAARLHTGSLAVSSDAVVEGAIRQAGVARAADEEELVDISTAFSALGHVDGGRVCVVASAGGFGVIAADFVESDTERDLLSMAELSDSTRERLGELMPAFATPSNPVDLTAGVTDDTYDQVLDTLQGDPGVDVILMSLELQAPGVSTELIDIAARRATLDRTPIIATVSAKDQSATLRQVTGSGVVAYPTMRRSVRSIEALVERGRYLRRST
ncbi:MAG: CoA-binding protein [Methanobacteriota archaeon]|nr:MAG: CoA-binding protein [Euryarchaeota archaeon]